MYPVQVCTTVLYFVVIHLIFSIGQLKPELAAKSFQETVWNIIKVNGRIF